MRYAEIVPVPKKAKPQAKAGVVSKGAAKLLGLDPKDVAAPKGD